MHARQTTEGDSSVPPALYPTPLATYTVTAPAVANGVVYFGAGNNVLGGNASTGERVWLETVDLDVNSPPVVANGTVYFGSDDGHVYAFQVAGMPAAERPEASSLKPDFTLPVSVP